MKGVFRLTRIVGLIAVIGLALAPPQAGAIVGGTYDDDNHPNVGIVYLPDRPWYAGFCSGSLLSEHEFLTAGHCTAAFTAEGRTPDRLFVSFDEQVGVTPEFVIFPAHPIAVTGWITHPKYSLPHNDVGVIHLARDVTGVTPIELAPAGFLGQKAALGELIGHSFVDVGYGINGTDRSYTSPQANITWDQRREVGSERFAALNPDVLHTFGGACGGDSGGPLFYGGGQPHLAVATVSAGAIPCNGPDTNQRLDTQSVHDFLDVYR
jgi:Trypsin